MDDSSALTLLDQEARALLSRLERVKPLALQETMVPAAMLPIEAQAAIDQYLAQGRRRLRGAVTGYLGWLEAAKTQGVTAAEAQRRFVLLRLRFNTVVTQFDIFADSVTQRSKHRTGVWLSGLDAVAADALELPGTYYRPPPVVCYLDREHGAAIRRAHTRLPGGGKTPVAIIRIPRERMIGSGIASSLVHEVGHQGSALLGLAQSIRTVLKARQRGHEQQRLVWGLWERWIAEILADLWSVARVGVSATHGLIGVVSLPRFFVFRHVADGPHPIPWIRVKLSCTLGRALFPDPQWTVLERSWEAFYPTSGLGAGKRHLLQVLSASMPGFVSLLLDHAPRSLRGRTLHDIFAANEMQPTSLRAQYRLWREQPRLMYGARPTQAFAVVGQAKVDNQITPEQEGHLLDRLLTYWAVQSRLAHPSACPPKAPPATALALVEASA